MSDWIGANWIWLLLGIGLLWFLFRRAGMGGGMGGHGGHSHHSEEVSGRQLPSNATSAGTDPGRHAGEDGKTTDAAAPPPRRRHGCC